MPAQTTDMELQTPGGPEVFRPGSGEVDYIVFGTGERASEVTASLRSFAGRLAVIRVVESVADITSNAPDAPERLKGIVVLPLMQDVVRGEVVLVGTPISKIREVYPQDGYSTSLIVDHGDDPTFVRCVVPTYMQAA